MSKAVPLETATGLAQVLRPISTLTHRTGGSKAAAVLEEACERGRAEGFEAGKEEGYRVGYRQAYADHEAELLGQLQAVTNLLETSVPAALQSWLDSTEVSLAKLAVAIAGQILGRELQEPEAVVSMVRSALEEVVQAKTARVRVNPFDAETLAPFADRLTSAGSPLRQVEIVRDPSIRGGCLVETDGGVIDARVDRMLEHALNDLRRVA